MVASDDDDEYDEEYEDKGRSDDDLLRKIGMLCQKCIDNGRIIKKLKMDLRFSKSHARQTKRQIMVDYDWDGNEANFAILVSSFVKEYLFPHYKILKDRWMEYDNGLESLSSFVQGKVNIPEGVEAKDQWERWICPTIHTKYVTIRCNLNNEIQKTYKSKCIQMRTKFLIILTMTQNIFFLVTGDPGRTAFDPDLLGDGVKIEQGSNILNQIFNLFARYVRKVTQMNPSASAYATLQGEVSCMLLYQVT